MANPRSNLFSLSKMRKSKNKSRYSSKNTSFAGASMSSPRSPKHGLKSDKSLLSATSSRSVPLIFKFSEHIPTDQYEKINTAFRKIMPKDEILEPELIINNKRIFHILDKAIEKLHIVLILRPLTANNGDLVRESFSNSEANFILDTLFDRLRHYDAVKYGNADVDQSLLNVLDKLSYFVLPVKAHSAIQPEIDKGFDSHLAKALEMLWTNKAIREMALNFDKSAADAQAVNFLDCFKKLRQIMEEKLSLSANVERERQRQLKMAYRSNLMYLEHIKDFEEQLAKQRTELNTELEKKKALINCYEDKIDQLDYTTTAEVEKMVHQSEKVMTEVTVESEELQKELSEQARQIAQQYQTLLQDDLVTERAMRTKRGKVEAQLAAWLAKYDADVGDRFEEFEEVQRQYDEEKSKMQQVRDELDAMDDEYTILMAEREEEQERIYNELAYKLLCIRSARKIQRYWRSYRERKMLRKSRKGKKKGGEKGKKSKKEKESKRVDIRKEDPNAFLEGKFKGDIMQDIQNPDAFTNQ